MTALSIEETCRNVVMDLFTSDPADVPRGYLKVRSVFGSLMHGDGVEILAFAGRYWVSACGDIVSVHDELEQAIDALHDAAYTVSRGTEAVWSTQQTAKALAARLTWFDAPIDGYTLSVNGQTCTYEHASQRFVLVTQAPPRRRARKGRQ